MPIRHFSGREGPGNRAPTQTRLHVGVVGDIAFIIVAHKTIARHWVVHGQDDHHKQKTQYQIAFTGRTKHPSWFLEGLWSNNWREMALNDYTQHVLNPKL